VTIYGSMVAAAVLRIAPGIFAQAYMSLLEFSTFAWIMAFSLFLTEYEPMLIGPRVDRN
jgi:uncharacterized protein involved in response to NO